VQAFSNVLGKKRSIMGVLEGTTNIKIEGESKQRTITYNTSDCNPRALYDAISDVYPSATTVTEPLLSQQNNSVY